MHDNDEEKRKHENFVQRIDEYCHYGYNSFMAAPIYLAEMLRRTGLTKRQIRYAAAMGKIGRWNPALLRYQFTKADVAKAGKILRRCR